MTESSEDKSKRTFASHLMKYHWPFQISVFYQDYHDIGSAINHAAKLRKSLPKGFRNHAFLWRLCINEAELDWLENRPETALVAMPFHTFWTNEHISEKAFKEFCQKRFEGPLHVRVRPYLRRWALGYAAKVIEKEPHDLRTLFPDTKVIHRYSFINRKKATPYEEE